MGLINNWLDKIGLSEQKPRFEAAGIVHPKHFLTLNASHFELLGVTTEDDRRKLLILCERVRKAEEKSRGKSNVTTSDTILAGSGEWGADEHRQHEEKKTDTKQTNSSKTALQSVQPRRSKRLATKSQDSTDNELPVVFPSLASAISPKARATSLKSTESRVADALKCHGTDNRLSQSQRTSKKTDNTGGTSSESSHCFISKGEENEFSNLKASEAQFEQQKSTDSTSSRRGAPASRLPGSLRTGKSLSAIPSESAAPPSPLVAFTSSDLNEEIEKIDDIPKRKEFVSKLSRKNSSVGSKRRATIAANGDELEELLQSSASESSIGVKLDAVLADVSDSDNESTASARYRRQIPQLNTSRASKSMSTSESDILKQYQTQELMIKRSSIVTRQIMRPVVDRRRSSAPCQEDNAPMLGHYSSAATKSTSSNTPPIVQGFNESDSWAMQIENLREDNDAEYNLFRDQVNYEQQHYFDMRIKVIVRKRPMSKSEADRAGGVDIIHPLDYGEFGKILVYQPKTRVDLTKEVETIPFAYDNVYGEESTNHQIYTRSLRNLIRPFLDGQWATCFAYGQTGSGKTYTMMGSNLTGINAGTASKDDSNLGLYYLAALEIFELLKEHQYYHLSLQVSLFEIYGGGKLYDLLNKREVIKCLENSHGKVCFPGLTQHPVHSPTEVMKLIEHGAENRSTGTTSRNADSSRSHAVLQLKLMKKIGRKADVEHSRFSFIDLAGSERGADTSNASKATRLEGADINTSLLALKEVIRALATGGSLTHIPFRGSKLTQVLKDSFVGENARCCMIACISPDIGNCEQTLNTLRYADRVKERNPENGALASSCEQPTRVVDMAQDVVTMTSDWKNVIRVNQPVHKVSSVETNRNDAQQLVTTAGLQLVADHKEVTKTWLEMLKSEAELIQAATDEEGWQAYYDQFEAYQSTEFDFLSKLRESLQSYILDRASDMEHSMTPDSGTSDDESFEDLRD